MMWFLQIGVCLDNIGLELTSFNKTETSFFFFFPPALIVADPL